MQVAGAMCGARGARERLVDGRKSVQRDRKRIEEDESHSQVIVVVFGRE